MQKSILSMHLFIWLQLEQQARSNTSTHYVLEVHDGAGWKECYLGTQQMTLLLDPQVIGTKNLSGKHNIITDSSVDNNMI